MVNKFIQHIPTFVDGVLPNNFEFETRVELLCKLKEMGYGNKDGSWFALSGSNTIMEVSDEGYRWWVCGSVRSTDGLYLPKWQAKERPKLTKEQNEKYLANCKARGIPTYNPSEVIITIGGHRFAGFAEDIE